MALGILTLTACSTLVKACTDATDVAPMSDYRALMLKQPRPWAISHAGMNALNMTKPVPPKLLDRPCEKCGGYGRCTAHDMPYRCPWCDGDGREPLRVFIHAGQQWDGPSLRKGSMNFHQDPLLKARAVHAFKGPTFEFPDAKAVAFGRPNDDGSGAFVGQPFGAVVAVATITGSHEGDGYRNDNACGNSVSECSPWAQFDYDKIVHHWQLADVTVLDTPVPAKGKQGLWKPDPGLVAAVEAQL